MADTLEFTGERFTPECEREIWYEHQHRYAFARQFCAGAEVLDAACGEGYGSALLASLARHVTGVDLSGETIAHAKSRYGEAENLAFRVADCTDLPFDEQAFDIIVSFETLEHLAAQSKMLAEFRRVLKDDGVLILSSPDRAEYSERQGFENPFHVRELYRSELEKLISETFPASRILGQKLVFHSAIYDEEGAERVSVQTLDADGGLAEGHLPYAPMYFIALCAARQENLPETASRLWLFADRDESVYQHYHHEIRKNMNAGGIIERRDARIRELEDALAGHRQPWWRRWIGRG